MTQRTAILAAGGTGGHLFPALSLGAELGKRGWAVHLLTDRRAERYAGDITAGVIHVVDSANPSSRNPFDLATAAFRLLRGYFQSRKLIRAIRPDVAIGFGGYPTLPPLLAARAAGIPTIVHEANTVMGRANRLLCRGAGVVATGFGSDREGVVVTGNPVRPAVLDAARKPYPRRGRADPFNLLVFGGSQGAQFFGEAVPEAVSMLDAGHRSALRVVHQVRREQAKTAARRYADMGVGAETAPFFDDMPARIADAHFVIARAGASTVTELITIGRPSLLVPYPHALDLDQARNAEALAGDDGAMLVEQRELSAERLSDILKNAIAHPQRLAKMAKNAKRGAKPDAASRLADLAEALARNSGKDGTSMSGAGKP